MTTLWATPVREYASDTLISVLPETPLSEVHAILLEHEISAVPVVDRGGALKGILSTTDLLREARIEIAGPGELARITPPPRTAGDLMRREVVTIDEDAPLGDAAGKMMKHHIHRVVVTSRGAPVGVISTRDAMQAVLYHRIEAPLERVMTASVVTIADDDTIRTAIERLDDANVRGLVVVDGTWPVGVFTHNEAIHARALPPASLEAPVERVMSYETICLDTMTPLYRVAGHAIQMRVRRILAVHQRELRGIVTGFDLVRIMTM
ncbi:MAG TPA: CBS domain-containing protein [Labilithrix sp.]|nr:CBS domain-containing protein [Labilithrix sp.]